MSKMNRTEMAKARKPALAHVAAMVGCTIRYKGEDGLIKGEAVKDYGWYGGADPMVYVMFGTSRRAVLKLSELARG